MKKTVLIIGGVIVVAGIAVLAIRRYNNGPKVVVDSVDWLTNTAQLSIGSTRQTLISGMAIPIGHMGLVIVFSPDNSSIVLSAPNALASVYKVYASKP
jgi:hypothetical protein